MLNGLFEFFVCPQHGLLRPDNLNLVVAYGQLVLTQLFILLKKAGIL